VLDSVTKKRIDDLRNILVGKIPSPQSQVEQITTGLIYKFMYDMDVEAINMGGIPSFFVGDYEKYSWKNLFDSKLGGANKVKLYSDAIESMYTNPTAPELFREIFKNSFLPFKDPSTLNMFLKEINEFNYSNSEKLGDAFEYLLSFMGSQGDAGQFRTPRHIIDFIIEMVDPQKQETILDPACGTAGFLISSFKHILDQNTDKKKGDQLNASERKQVGQNLVGYDISPDMTRISLVNMYLHQFANPQIQEYDTLSSEDRWNEYYDVILANPPFFSPTGGIQPHSRFGVKSTRAEVLFVDYIIGHLKPNGRAGIVVPEGVVFQLGTAYKTLRKNLIDNGLVGVISLPVGVFQPYSGVKTSILVIDKKLGQQKKDIFFAKIKNDGFSLNSNRTPINNTDLPSTSKDFNEWKSNNNLSSDAAVKVSKDLILATSDFSLSQNAYLEQKNFVSKFPILELGEVCNFEGGTQPPKSTFIDKEQDGYIRLIQTRDYKSDKFKVYIPKTERHKTCNAKDIMIGRYGPPVFQIFRGLTGAYNVALMKCIPDHKVLTNDWLYQLLKSEPVQERIIGLSERVRQSGVRPQDLKTQKVPLPPIEIQQQIINELDEYQKIIDGCKQVVDNFKPNIDIEPSWDIKNLGEVCDVRDGTHDSPRYVEDGYPFITSKNVINGNINFSNVNLISREDLDKINKRSKVDQGDILMPMIGTIGRPTIVDFERDFAIKNVALIKCTDDSILSGYVRTILDSDYFTDYLRQNEKGSTQKFISLGALRSFPIPVPRIEVQYEIVQKIEEQISIVNGNNRLLEIYSEKIQNKISKVWGN